MVVRPIEMTTMMCNAKEVENVVIWMQLDPPTICKLNRVDYYPEKIYVITTKCIAESQQRKAPIADSPRNEEEAILG